MIKVVGQMFSKFHYVNVSYSRIDASADTSHYRVTETSNCAYITQINSKRKDVLIVAYALIHTSNIRHKQVSAFHKLYWNFHWFDNTTQHNTYHIQLLNGLLIKPTYCKSSIDKAYFSPPSQQISGEDDMKVVAGASEVSPVSSTGRDKCNTVPTQSIDTFPNLHRTGTLFGRD